VTCSPGLDELPRFEDGQFIEASDSGEKVGDFNRISSQTGDRPTLWTAELPINFGIVDFLQRHELSSATGLP